MWFQLKGDVRGVSPYDYLDPVLHRLNITPNDTMRDDFCRHLVFCLIGMYAPVYVMILRIASV